LFKKNNSQRHATGDSVKLASIEVRNYRSIFCESGDPSFGLKLGDGVNAIAGPNNTGKSNLFRALALALDPDFHFNRSLDVPAQTAYAKPTVTLTFHIPKRGVAARERTLLRYLEEYEKKVKPGSNRTYAQDGCVKLRVTLEGSEQDRSGSRRQVFVVKGAGALTLPDDDPHALKTVAQFHKCFHFVMIRSGESLETLLAGKFRDILQNVLREDLRDAYAAAEKSRDRYQSELREGLLKPITARIGQVIADLFPEIDKVQLVPDVRALEETLTNMSVALTDVASTDLADKGTGVRGGLLIAMLRHFADVGKRSMLFAVEEPESFLHPAAQEQLREDLEALAERRDTSVLLTTHSPYIVSREPNARVFAVDKDRRGRTRLVAEAAGSDPQAQVLGGLFRDRLVVEVLDRSHRVPSDAKVVVVVEGSTDAEYARIALRVAGRPDLLKGLEFLPAGLGVAGSHAGGASLVVMQALVMRSISNIPVVALLDNDTEGRSAEKTLKQIGLKTKDWKLGRTLFNYRDVFHPGNATIAYEAEDLWADRLLARFVKGREDERLKAKRQRPNPEGGWQYDLVPASKGSFVEFLSSHAKASDAILWVELFEKIRAATR
jgi:putative ATP-dependent endonuclease of OLD family